jgi:hypothetical protein
MLHVDIPTLAEFRALAETRADVCLSLYLPTSPLPQEAAAARIAFRNLSETALAQAVNAAASRAGELALRDTFASLEDYDEFWRYQARSLAVLATPDTVRTFRLANRLNASFEVADRFFLKPLLRAITFPHEAFVLALSENSVRLVEVVADLPADSVAVANLPASAADALGRSINERSPRGRLQGSEGQKVLLTQYARQVDSALRPVLVGREAPVLLAAVQPLASIFRAITNIPTLASETIQTSPDRLTDAELGAAARPILDGLYARDLQLLRDRFEQRRAQGRATRDVAEAARAATFGAIETLLVDIDVSMPGTVNEEDGRITLGEARPEQTYGVIDEIGRRALLTGARVLGVRASDLPEEDGAGPLAATLRYRL